MKAERSDYAGARDLLNNPAIAAWALSASEYLPGRYRRALMGRPDRPAVRCLLPGCDVWTTHRGGYCCAEHCRKHKEACR